MLLFADAVDVDVAVAVAVAVAAAAAALAVAVAVALAVAVGVVVAVAAAVVAVAAAVAVAVQLGRCTVTPRCSCADSRTLVDLAMSTHRWPTIPDGAVRPGSPVPCSQN